MKKQLFIARPARHYSTVILTSILLFVAALDVYANDKKETANGSAITYVGTSESIMTFNIKYSNTTEEKVVLEVLDDVGTVLYKHITTEKMVNKNIYLKNAGEKCTVKFSLHTAKEDITQRFQINPKTIMVNQFLVTSL